MGDVNFIESAINSIAMAEERGNESTAESESVAGVVGGTTTHPLNPSFVQAVAQQIVQAMGGSNSTAGVQNPSSSAPTGELRSNILT